MNWFNKKGYATSVDITECLNVSAPSVTKMMRRLDLKGYLEYEKYRGIRLTNQGKVVAENIKKKTNELPNKAVAGKLRMLSMAPVMSIANAKVLKPTDFIVMSASFFFKIII